MKLVRLDSCLVRQGRDQLSLTYQTTQAAATAFTLHLRPSKCPFSSALWLSLVGSTQQPVFFSRAQLSSLPSREAFKRSDFLSFFHNEAEGAKTWMKKEKKP